MQPKQFFISGADGTRRQRNRTTASPGVRLPVLNYGSVRRSLRTYIYT
ncbi:MAG: hypothetical protein IKJ04_04215 [Clostridia bacterium]|nr:hypothetical protein [Clostridia bacterium]